MTITLSPTGDLKAESWTYSDGVAVFFPESIIEVGGKKKSRGVSHVCVPIFGAQPANAVEYHEVELPQHGLMRNSDFGIQGSHFKSSNDGHVTRIFAKPWSHETRVSFQYLSEHIIEHKIKVRASEDMPLSVGFHPYFATHGENFVIEVENNGEWSEVPANKQQGPYQLYGNQARVRFGSGREVTLSTEGYDAFCVWSDRPDLYVCLEPIWRGFGMFETLEAGSSKTFTTKIKVS